ncbi:hypothetical protein MA16_Dca017484 [Dendrobium catenatum]|uniref:Uncharacterized protein n=1 Tax=Dendrobium catenatum TaxID=906689 RepID=A0A2I0X2Y6_9ASPA|nr:hypothetical protein MA16_Dca017484 [Dendrobium catenatum]
MKCEPQLQEQHAIEILLKNIHGPVAFLLKGFTIKTFEKLLNKASSLQDSKKLKPQKVFEKKSGTVSAVDKGKQPINVQAERSPPQFYNQQQPAKLSIYDALILSKELREALIKALLDPNICMAQLVAAQPDEALCSRRVPEVSFSDEDICLVIPGKAGIGLVFITPEKGLLRYSYHLLEPCTNNEAEYEALITGLELAISMEIEEIKIFGDSQLIINQVAGIYKVLKPKLLPYYQYTMKLLEQIPNVTLYRIPRGRNSMADALAKLAKELACIEEEPISIEVQGRKILSPIDLEYINKIFPSKGEIVLAIDDETVDWRKPFIDYLQENKLPHEKSAADQIKRRALSYTLINGTLYRRSFDQLWLRCLNKQEAQKIVTEVHAGLCGAHQSGPKMKMKIKRLGYYWPSMINDCMSIARRCHQCQVHGVVLHQPPNVLHPTIASWPFESWGTDIIGPIDPPSSKGHRFILAATDYFSKWAEAVPLREVKTHNVLQFFRDHIVYRFGIPRRIISDNGPSFKSTKLNNFAKRHNIDWRYSTSYYPQANGLAEAFNKTLVGILKKSLEDNKRQWHEKLGEALWAYRTTYRTPTQSTPFALVFGAEAVLPLEVQLPSLRVAVNNSITSEQNARLRLEELEGLEEKRLQAQQNLELYKSRMAQAHDKLVRPRTFRVGELVLVLRRPILTHRRFGGKFEPTWEGPFVVEKVYQGGSYQLVDCKGDRPMLPINGRFLKKYYV